MRPITRLLTLCSLSFWVAALCVAQSPAEPLQPKSSQESRALAAPDASAASPDSIPAIVIKDANAEKQQNAIERISEYLEAMQENQRHQLWKSLSSMLWSIGGWVVLGLIGGRMLAYRGYSPLVGVLIGIVLGPIGLVLCWLLPGVRDSDAREKAVKGYTASKKCPNCGRQCGGLASICPRCSYAFSDTK